MQEQRSHKREYSGLWLLHPGELPSLGKLCGCISMWYCEEKPPTHLSETFYYSCPMSHSWRRCCCSQIWIGPVALNRKSLWILFCCFSGGCTCICSMSYRGSTSARMRRDTVRITTSSVR